MISKQTSEKTLACGNSLLLCVVIVCVLINETGWMGLKHEKRSGRVL